MHKMKIRNTDLVQKYQWSEENNVSSMSCTTGRQRPETNKK